MLSGNNVPFTQLEVKVVFWEFSFDCLSLSKLRVSDFQFTKLRSILDIIKLFPLFSQDMIKSSLLNQLFMFQTFIYLSSVIFWIFWFVDLKGKKGKNWKSLSSRFHRNLWKFFPHTLLCNIYEFAFLLLSLFNHLE